jgi:hypothetical protein
VRLYTRDEVVAALQIAVDAAGGSRQFCDLQPNTVENSNVYATLAGRLKPGGIIAASVGFRRVTIETYIELDADYTPPAGYELVPDRLNVGGRGNHKPGVQKRHRDIIKIKPQKEPISWPRN